MLDCKEKDNKISFHNPNGALSETDNVLKNNVLYQKMVNNTAERYAVQSNRISLIIITLL